MLCAYYSSCFGMRKPFLGIGERALLLICLRNVIGRIRVIIEVSVVGKVFCKVLNYRLVHCLDKEGVLHEGQAGFRAHHALIDLIDDDESLAKEQDVLDSHDDLIAELGVRVKQVIAASSPSSVESSRRIASSKLAHLQKSLSAISSIVSDTTTAVSDTCVLRQYEEKTNDINKDLVKARDDLHHMELDEGDELFTLLESLEKQVFDCSVCIKILCLVCLRLLSRLWKVKE